MTTKTKVLPSRKKKASKGKVIRVSNDVYEKLEWHRRGRMSWDDHFRRQLGLPDRKGVTRPVLEGWLEQNSGQLYLDEAEARGASVIAAAKQKSKKVKPPIKMREVV